MAAQEDSGQGMSAEALTGGFANAPVEAARAFRTVLDAMARPGRIAAISGATPPAALSRAAGAVLLTLADPLTPVHLAGGCDDPAVIDWIRFHTGAPIAPREAAAFAVGSWQSLAPLDAYPIGTAEYPDRSATLIVECATLSTCGAQLSGPGIKGTTGLAVPDLKALQRNAALYPLGLDFIFCAGDRLAALPRTTRVEAF